MPHYEVVARIYNKLNKLQYISDISNFRERRVSDKRHFFTYLDNSAKRGHDEIKIYVVTETDRQTQVIVHCERHRSSEQRRVPEREEETSGKIQGWLKPD
jgi:hypothetical protein